MECKTKYVDVYGKTMPYSIGHRQRLLIWYNINASRVKNIILTMLCMFVVVYTVTIALMVNNYIDASNQEILELRREANSLREYKQGYDVLSSRYSEIVSENAAIVQENTDMKTVITETDATIEALKSEIKTLREDNKALTKKYNNIAADMKMVDKYKYALINEAGKRTDLTLDEMKLGISLMEEKGYDPHILFSIGMVESGYNKTCTSNISTAKGYHQFLNGTAKFTYETLLGNGKGSWSPNVAFNGETNIKMCVAYFDYLMKKHGNFYGAVGQYCGAGTKKGSFTYTYIDRMNKHASRSGANIYSIINKMT